MLHTEDADRMVFAYLTSVYSNFTGLHKILSDIGTEFKNKLFMQGASTLEIKQDFSSLCYPQGNGHIENTCKFLNTCV